LPRPGTIPAAGEALALRAYLQNVRVAVTLLDRGDLGESAPSRQIPVGERLDGWQLTGMAGDPDGGTG